MLNEFNDDNEIIMPGSNYCDREGHRTRSMEAPGSITLLVLLSVTKCCLNIKLVSCRKTVSCNMTMLIVLLFIYVF